MKKFKNFDYIATVTDKVVRWEIPIANLIDAFENSPENPSEDGENFVSIRRGKKKEFAEFIAKALMYECDQNTGESYIEKALSECFREHIFEDYKEFAKYPEDEE